MKLKVLFQAALLLALSVCAAQAVTVTNVRRNPFYAPPLRSVSDLRSMMQIAQEDIRDGLYQAGYPELYQPLMRQFPQADVSRVDYQPGENFIWMLSKVYGSVQVVNDMTWGGRRSMPAYEFSIYSNGSQYIFAVPLVCGNLALKEVISGGVSAADSGYSYGDSGSYKQSSGGQVGCLSCYGFRFVADVGYLHQSDPADYLLLRAGVEHSLSRRLSLLAMVGGAPHLDGTDGDDAILVDFLLQYDWFRFMFGNQWSQAFVGVGLGGWITSGDDNLEAEDTDVDLIANIGARIYGRPETFNASLFFEARSGLDELDTLGEYGRFGAGLRMRF
ncbi:hypothetical protein [Candidatus Electronema sp. JC]|uniref:hypothetical protein n=1 Tax=Candidatus Electronema sp. JC TaxID=3401570 RepID=UPI003B438B87